MTSIYSNASHVVAWLGEDDGEAEEAPALIHMVAKSILEQIMTFGGMPNKLELSQEGLTLSKGLKWTSLAKLLQRPLFFIPLLDNSRNVSRQECRSALWENNNQLE